MQKAVGTTHFRTLATTLIIAAAGSWACQGSSPESSVPSQLEESSAVEANDSPGGARTQEQAEEPSPRQVKSLEDLPPGANVVQYEMQLLMNGMNNILRLIADNRLEGIPGEIGKVHPVYELTHEALEKGLYAPPHNSDQIEAFKAQDEAFHDDLVVLVRAARRDDLETATKTYGKLVEGCTSCHARFRFAPTEP